MRVAIAILPEVREILRDDPSQLGELLDEIHHEDLADLLKMLGDDEAIKLLEQLDVDDAADVFERLDEDEQTDMVAQFGPGRMAPIVSEMAPDDRTDLIESLPPRMGDRLMEELHPDAAAEVAELIAWPEDTAGGLMTTELIRVQPDLTTAQVIRRLREQGGEAETINYVYAVENDGTLAGVASLRDLILANDGAKLRDIMNETVHAVPPSLDQEDVARLLRKYDFTAMPVVDDARHLLGLVTIDDVMDVVKQEQDEDVQLLAAVQPIEEQYFKTSFVTFLRKRVPWLAVLFIGQFITESALRAYDPVIQAVAQLTYYLPMLVSTGGNSGGQSASLIIRGLATGDIHIDDWWRVLRRELGQGLVLGLLLAAVGMARVHMLSDVPGMEVTIGLSVVAIVVMGCTVGAMLPLLLRRLGLDPAASSTPFIATCCDVLGIVIYFSLAQTVLRNVLAAAGI